MPKYQIQHMPMTRISRRVAESVSCSMHCAIDLSKAMCFIFSCSKLCTPSVALGYTIHAWTRRRQSVLLAAERPSDCCRRARGMHAAQRTRMDVCVPIIAAHSQLASLGCHVAGCLTLRSAPQHYRLNTRHDTRHSISRFSAFSTHNSVCGTSIILVHTYLPTQSVLAPRTNSPLCRTTGVSYVHMSHITQCLAGLSYLYHTC